MCSLNHYKIVALFSSILLFASCKKFVQTDIPKTQIANETVFSSDATSTAAITGLYGRMEESLISFFNGGLTLYAGFSSDELTYASTNSSYAEFYQNSISPSNTLLKNDAWAIPYRCIYHANAIIEGLQKPSNVSASMKQQIIGEAKFIRAFCHFYLLNLFGDVPLVTSTDYTISRNSGRTSKEKVYAQIILDLKDAQSSLSETYIGADRVRPNKWSATALLSRVYLYVGDWQNAEKEATRIIDQSGQYMLEQDLNKVFLKNSTETIWQLMPVVPNFNTVEGYLFYSSANVPTYGSLSASMVAAFETGDKRKENWTRSYTAVQGYTMPNKYKVATSSSLTEYNIVFRLAELYLIRAEARAKENDLPAAISDLNVIRNRAGLASLADSLTQQEVIAASEHERRVELFTEWGHRWLDLKRTGRADYVLAQEKGAYWQATDTLYPIPLSEIQNDPNLHQNPGY